MNTLETQQAGAKKQAAGWRIKVAYAFFIISLVGMPVLVPLVALLGFSATFIATFTGVGAVTAELMLVAGAAIAGKEGFAHIKATVFRFLRQYGPPATVGKARYTIGLILFILPFLYGFAAPYVGEHIPGLEEHEFTYAIAGDLLLVTSLIVLGGDFWDKLRSLFIYDARAAIPEKTAKQAAAS